MLDTTQQLKSNIAFEDVTIKKSPPVAKIDPEFKAVWVARLRSGQDTQGTGALRRLDADGVSKLCCLGVACEIKVKQGTLERREDHTALNGTVTYTYGTATEYRHSDQNSASLPRSVADEIAADGGYLRTNPAIPDPGGIEEFPVSEVPTVSLAELNDSGFTFAQIADLIEKYL